MNGHITLASIEETSVVVNWTTTTPINKLEYSTDDGETWTQQSVVAGTGDICRITELVPNTIYNIVLRLSYVEGSSTISSNTNTLIVSTVDYPHIISIEKTNLLIEDSQTIAIYNPLNREVTITMYRASATDTGLLIAIEDLYTGTTNDTNFTFTPNADILYGSIPNTQYENCLYTLTYSSRSEQYIPELYAYSIDVTKTGVGFRNFTYKDTNPIVSKVLGTDQELVGGLSNLEVTIKSSDKMIASKGATPAIYGICYNYNYEIMQEEAYVDGDITVDFGTIPRSLALDEIDITVDARDSRELATTVHKYAKYYDYEEPTIEVTGVRLNNFEEETTFKINGTHCQIIKDGVDKNNLTLTYVCSEKDTGNVVSTGILEPIINGNNVTCEDVILSLDKSKSYTFNITIKDSFEKSKTNSCTIDEGQAIFFISNNKRACYINGQKIVMPFNLPVATVKDTPSYYLLAKLPSKSNSNGTLRINGFLGDRASSFKAVIDCLIANRGSLNVSGTWYGTKYAFTYLNDIEIYEQPNGEAWIYLKVKSTINGGVSLNIEGTDILSDEYSYEYVTTPSGTLVYTINNDTLLELNKLSKTSLAGDFITVALSTQQSIRASKDVSYNVAFNKILEKDGSNLTLTNNAVKIGKDISVISVTAHVYAFEGGTSHKQVAISKNDEHIMVKIYRNCPNYTHMEGTKVIKVKEGDLITAQFSTETAGTYKIQNYDHGTYMCVTVIK